jgi:excisionase family DNA binding protein
MTGSECTVIVPGIPHSDKHIIRGDQDWYSWLTTQEAATLSGYDIQHVRRLAREGKIDAVKRGRDWAVT